MHFNLLRFTYLPTKKKTQQLWGIVLGLLILLAFSAWQIKNYQQRVNEKNILNLKLQKELFKLNQINKLQKQATAKTKPSIKELSAKIAKDKTTPSIENLSLQINYANASDIAGIIHDKNNSLLSERGNVVTDSRTNTLWVEDINEKLQKITKLIKALDTPKKQVLIEARIVMMTRDNAEDLGVKFGFIQNKETSKTSLGNKVAFNLSALPLTTNPANLGLSLATLNKSALLDLELSALQSEGRAEIIASPKLITTNQEQAIIESGEDIPYQRLTVSGGTSVAFKKAVLSLKVVPQITFNGKLIMSITINQDTDSGRRVQGVPIISTKYLATKVMIADNQTIVLGGIYKEDKNNNTIRVPILGTLPWVGGLFRRNEKKYSNEELLIFLTPKILEIR